MYDILSKWLIYSIYKLEKQIYMQQISVFFNAATAKKDDHPENILVRKGVPLSKLQAISLC